MTTHAQSLPATSWKSTLTAAGIGAVGGFALNSAIAVVARGLLGAPAEFQPLSPAVYGPLTVIGALLGALGWRIVVARSADPASLLRILVPSVLVASLIPDVVLLVADSQPGVTVAGVVALMLMHVAIAAVAVPAYRRFMPPNGAAARR